MSPLVAALALLGAAFGVVCAVAGALWARLRVTPAWHEAVREAELLAELTEGWLWRTDDALRIVQWRPPAGSPSAWQAPSPVGALLPEIARGADPGQAPDATTAALGRQLREQAAVNLPRVMLQLGDSARSFSLRGLPRRDARGRFLGYVGTARACDEAPDGGFARAAMAQLMAQAGASVLLFERSSPEAAWRLQGLGPGARTLLGREDRPGAPLPLLDWNDCCARLPEDVRGALADLAPGETRVAGAWSVAWAVVPAAHDPQAGRLLVLRRTQAPEAPAADSADHESFVYSVSHDLRAPIRVVEGFARILKEDYGRFLDRIGNDHTDRILAAAARMNSMIDALLALSRLQSQPLKRQPVDLSQLTRYILEDLRGQAPERRVEAEIEPGLVIQGDPTLMRIAIENLVGNAWKYSNKAPVARIELRREQLAGQSTFVVADNGAGFDMRFADRLFGVFQRLHSAKDFPGTGVGLASVRRIIRRHGGDIWAESEVGKGARFYFTLP